MNEYEAFLDSKRITAQPAGFEPGKLHPEMFDYQRDVTRWAIRRGRAALFQDCGLGKTFEQIEWSREVQKQTKGKVLIVAPLAVAEQTIEEAKRFGTKIKLAESDDDCKKPGVYITNYEKLHKFTPIFAGIVLDESSILKSFDGSTRKTLVEFAKDIPYRLACTATPSPNDYTELGNHAEFLGIMSMAEMLATFFVHDSGETSKWRLKGHAEREYWKWIAQWAVCQRRPSDLGYSDEGFELPALNIIEHILDAGPAEGMLFAQEARTLQERRNARRSSLEERARGCAEMVNASDEQWIVWCDLNDESDLLRRLIPHAVEVAGSTPYDKRADYMLGFASGKYRVIVTKGSVAGFGMNWQQSHNQAHCGLTDSFELFYQKVRRQWRFGQKMPVGCYIFLASTETAVLSNVKRKQAEAEKMAEAMVEHMKEFNQREITNATERERDTYATTTASGNGWTAYLGDAVESIHQMPDESFDFSIYSPPFGQLYVYSNSERDMGNSRNWGEFWSHYDFLVQELYRVLKPGRGLAFHCMTMPTSKQAHGVIGAHDFRGDLIRAHLGNEAAEMHAAIKRLERRAAEARENGDTSRCLKLENTANVILEDLRMHPGKTGMIFHSEVTIFKNPVTAMQRTKALGLLHKTIQTNRVMARQGFADYLVTMRKPGEADDRITGLLDTYIGEQLDEEFTRWCHQVYNTERTGEQTMGVAGGIRSPMSFETFKSVQIWQRYASPVWMDIDPSVTLQRESAREQKDERHIAPLQLQVIERAIQLWTQKGDRVLSPFGGIGSEGFVAVKMGREAVICELKKSYFTQAVLNLKRAEEIEGQQGNLFAVASEASA